VTGEQSFFYDVYQDENGQPAYVSAAASHKIHWFVRQRDVSGIYFDEPMTFWVYNKQVTIIDERAQKGMHILGEVEVGPHTLVYGRRVAPLREEEQPGRSGEESGGTD
jgi:hypothetical protein